MMMDAVKIVTLPTTKPLLSKIYESTDSSRNKIDDISFAEEIEDEEMRLRLSDEEENEQDNITANVQNQQTSSQLKKDDLKLDTPAIVNSEETSEVKQQELKKTDTNTEHVDTTASANPEEPSEVCQQELKDSTDTGVKEEEYTPVSANTEEKSEASQQELKDSTDIGAEEKDTPVSVNIEEKFEASQQESEDLNTSVEKTVDTSDSAKPEEEEEQKQEELSENCEQEQKDSEATDEEDNLSSNGDLDEEFLTENGNASDEESEMGDRMGHTQKYWAGGFNPRPWKGGTRKRPSFPHRGSKSWYHQQYPDRDKLKKNNLHHSNSHFIRTSRSRTSFGNSLRDSWSRDARRGETSESLRLKKASKDVSGSKDNPLKQNGVANAINGLEHKENNSSTQNDKSITVINKADKVGVKNKEIISTLQSKRALDPKLSSEPNGRSLSGIASASLTDKGKSSSEGAEIEVLSEPQIQIKDVTSQNNGLDNRFKDVDENTNDKPDSTSDLICIQSNVRDPSEKTGKNDEFSCVTIVQEKSNGTSLEKRDKVLENNKSGAFSEMDKDTTVKNYQSVTVDLNTESSQNNEDDWRDSESGSLVIDESIQAKENKSSNDKDNAESDGVKASEKSSSAKNKDQNGLNNVIEEVDLIDDDSQEATLKSSNADVNASHTVPNDTINGNQIDGSSQDGETPALKKRRRKRLAETMSEELIASESENGGRQKRRSARNAEEMIRKEILKGNDDEENSSDETEKMVRVNYRKSSAPNIITRTLSPPTLKRTLDEVVDDKDNAAAMTLKRIRTNEDASVPMAQECMEQLSPMKSKESVAATGQLMRKVSQEDIRGKLKKLTQEELEALLLQKVVECITVRGEMGKLREQARASKKSQESLRTKCQQLQKQVEGFEMVLKRINYDKNTNGDKYVPPIKINRSVGLQVNFLCPENGIQSLKQLQSGQAGIKSSISQKPSNSTMTSAPDLSPRKMMKTRSPRRPEMSTATMVQVPPAASVATQANSTGALVMTAKPADLNAKRPGNVLQIVSQAGNQQQTSGSRTLTIQRPTSTTAARASDLIDLTDEEDKSKVSAVMPITAGGPPARMQRVLQVPTGVTLANATNLRLVPTSNSQAGMGNNVQRIAYVMQGGPNGVAVPTRLQVLTSTTPMKGVTTITTAGVNYKRGVATLPNGAVRLLTTQAPTVQALKHPAPLPETPMPASDSSWKLAPPAPSLKISKVATGIVLSWNMSISDKYADIVSYQLYAYQEVAGTPPSAALWKKVGDVRALPLPMACTLTQFTEGNNYYFAVRAVDAHSRFGQYSKPGNISL